MFLMLMMLKCCEQLGKADSGVLVIINARVR